MLLATIESTGDAGRLLLRYQRDAIFAGEWWRLLTGHLVHLGWAHLALNLMGLALMWALFAGDYAPRQWLIILAGSVVAIDVGFLVFNPDLAWYVGLSGVLHGVMLAGTIAHWRRREPDAWLLALFLVAKLVYEQTLGVMPFSAKSAGGPVVVDAHLYGAIGALVVLAGLTLLRKPL
ncbi:MAG TPA: rhombosortase [Steroidobacteraceae bacterium]|nr:rhombosortase [Steroidobacteraceae bacterium]